jgi:hypothetical protein
MMEKRECTLAMLVGVVMWGGRMVSWGESEEGGVFEFKLDKAAKLWVVQYKVSWTVGRGCWDSSRAMHRHQDEV